MRRHTWQTSGQDAGQRWPRGGDERLGQELGYRTTGRGLCSAEGQELVVVSTE